MKEKTIKLDNFYTITLISDIKLAYSVSYSNTSYYSYNFYPLELLEIIHNISKELITAKIVLFNIIIKSIDDLSDKNDIDSKLDSFKHILVWFINILCRKIK